MMTNTEHIAVIANWVCKSSEWWIYWVVDIDKLQMKTVSGDGGGLTVRNSTKINSF